MSRVLNPPGGASSNIFGSDPDPHQQQRQQQHREIADSNQNQSAQYSVPPAGQTQEPKQEDLHSRNRPTKKGEAPYAENDMENLNGRHGSSQNESDFRCHSVTAYREAIARNAGVRDRAHGGQATSVNPITHQDYNGVGQPNQYYQNEAPPPPAHMPSQDYGRRDQPRASEGFGSALPRHSHNAYRDAVTRNAEIRHKYQGGQAAQTFNLITHEEFNGDGSHIRQESQFTAPPPPPEAQILPEQSYGRRDKPTRAATYNPITGEEYPEDYGQKKNEAMKNGEEKVKDEENEETKKEESNTPTVSKNNNQPTGTPTRNIRPSSRVLQPPGGASTTSLW